MKICFITNNIFKLGGVERVLSVVASELSKLHEVTVLCTEGKNKLDRSIYNLTEEVIVDINPAVTHRPLISKCVNKIGKDINKYTGAFNKKNSFDIASSLYFPKDVKKNMIDYINSNQFDIVIGVQGKFALFMGAIKNEIKAKVMGWQHNSYDAYLKNKNRYHWNQDVLFEEYVSALDRYIVLTDYDKEMFKKEKGIEAHVIHNPKSFVSDLKSPLEKKRFLAAGRFNVQKGFDLLIESFNLFSKKNDEWNLVIVGEGKDKEKIEKLIQKYNLQDRIEIHGFTKDIQKYFMDSSVLLLPSRWEGMPMIVLESLEMGVPIVSYDITASIQIICDNKEGLIVPKYNVEKFADAMIEIVNDEEMRKGMSINCMKRANDFDVECIAKEWNYVFQEITEEKVLGQACN